RSWNEVFVAPKQVNQEATRPYAQQDKETIHDADSFSCWGHLSPSSPVYQDMSPTSTEALTVRYQSPGDPRWSGSPSGSPGRGVRPAALRPRSCRTGRNGTSEGKADQKSRRHGTNFLRVKGPARD